MGAIELSQCGKKIAATDFEDVGLPKRRGSHAEQPVLNASSDQRGKAP
jgi:hypothetical protein